MMSRWEMPVTGRLFCLCDMSTNILYRTNWIEVEPGVFMRRVSKGAPPRAQQEPDMDKTIATPAEAWPISATTPR